MYIYTVKPIKEAIKIAIQHDMHYSVDEDGHLTIYGIDAEKWPAGVSIKSPERIKDHSIYNVGPHGYAVALEFFTETTEKEVPEFIKGLYDAMTAGCGNIRCEKCPLDIMGDCTIFTQFIRDKWGIGK